MDILYCIGEGSKWNNNELRYSLRSLEKFGKNVGNIYMVGYNPGFLSDEVTFINCPCPSLEMRIMFITPGPGFSKCLTFVSSLLSE